MPFSASQITSHIRPVSLRPAATRARRFSPAVWWHLLSLDAPTVAVTWCWFLGAIFQVHLSGLTLVTLGLGTWCVYVADRLLDAQLSTDMSDFRDRHWFYLRHHRLFSVAWLGVALPLTYLILFRVDSGLRAGDVVLCCIGIAYFLGIHRRAQQLKTPRRFSLRLPKECAVGFLFAMATAMPTWMCLKSAAENSTSFGVRIFFVSAVLTFGAVCWLNCTAIQTWEDADLSEDAVHTILSGQAVPKGLTAFLGRHLTTFAASTALASAVLTCLSAKTPFWPVYLAVMLSASIFLLLLRQRTRWSTLALRIAADAALLTPLFFLPWLLFR